MYFLAAAPAGSISKFFFKRQYVHMHIESFKISDVCVFIAEDLSCVLWLLLLWLCSALRIIYYSWTCWLTTSDYYISFFPQTSSEVLIWSTICKETLYFARCVPKIVIFTFVVSCVGSIIIGWWTFQINVVWYFKVC